MVYIYKKIVGGKPYYYLRVSERRGKRVLTKDIAYLGSTIEGVRKNLEKVSSHKEEIKKAYRTIHIFLETNYYLEKAKKLKLRKDIFLGDKLEGVESCRIHFQEKFNQIDEITKKEILKNFLIEFAFNTTSMEGNTINLEEAKNLLQEGLTPKDRTLREIYDLQNTEKVFFDLYKSEFKEELNHNLIVKIHDNLMENIDVRKGYRRTDVRVIRSNFDATPAPYVKTDMDLLLKWCNKNKDKLHPLVLAAIFHHKFEKIHPFMDGNGRTGRILLNYILLKQGYPPLIIHKKTRKEYLDAMRKADKSVLNKAEKGDYSQLITFNAQEMIDSYWSIFL
jgi:fido (protein-threonine AMPylation protein)